MPKLHKKSIPSGFELKFLGSFGIKWDFKSKFDPYVKFGQKLRFLTTYSQKIFYQTS